MLQWDGNLAKTEERATVFEYWERELGKLGPPSFTGTTYWTYPAWIINTINSTSNSSQQWCSGDCYQFAANAFSQVISIFGNPSVPNMPAWGDRHIFNVDHQVMSETALACLFDRHFSWGGDAHTINVADRRYNYDGNDEDVFITFVGPSYRQIIDLSTNNMDTHSVFVIPGGQSGNVLDPQYDNLLPLWQNDQYISMKMKGYTTKHKLTLEK